MRLLARGVALLIMVLPGVSLPLGLGEIEVNTALNQPLYAEIKLHSVQQNELEDMRVVVASDAAFKRAGIDRPFVLNQLRFNPKMNSAGQAVIEITSKAPVREPFLNFLLEVQWSKGRLLREYTVLLDPPVMFDQADAVGIQPPVAEQRAGSAPSAINRSSSASTVESKGQRYPVNRTEQPQSFPAAQVDSQSYQTKSGDTLSEIAANLSPNEETSLPQMMIALLRANPESFMRGNINELMAGVIMRVPDREEIEAVDRVQASEEVLRHNTLWRQYRSKLTAIVPTKPSGQFEGRIQSPGQKPLIEGPSSGQVLGAETRDGELQILAADKQGAEEGGNLAADAEISQLRKDAALARELAESRSAENKELRSRVQQLEEMLANQERLINLQSEELATLQNRLASVEQTASAMVTEMKDEPSAAVTPLESSSVTMDANMETADIDTPSEASRDSTAFDQGDAEAVDSDATVSSVDSNNLELSASEQQDAEQAQTTANNETEVAPIDTDSSDAPAGSETQVEPTVSEPPSVSEAQSEPVETPSSTEDASDRITANPMILAVVAGTVLLLAVLSWLFINRFRKSKGGVQDDLAHDQHAHQSIDSVSTTESMASQNDDVKVQDIDEEIESDSMSETAIGDVDSESLPEESPETRIGPREGSETDVSMGSPDQDDTLTEADVYIAYNLHQQAEDLLKEALAGDPERDDYRIKLLENYCASKEIEPFDTVAEELRVRTGGTGELWERVLSLANKISPDHFLLADSTPSGAEGTSAEPESLAPDAGLESDGAQQPDADLVGDMGPGYLSELESEPEPDSTDFTPSSPEEVSKDELEFDVSDLDLSFQDDSGEESTPELLGEESSDSKPLDFELSELGVELDTDAHVEGEQWTNMVDLVPSGDEELITSAVEEQSLDEIDLVSSDPQSSDSINESDPYALDSEFAQSTSPIDLDEEGLLDGLAEESPENGLLMPLDEAATDILTPLSGDSATDNGFDHLMEEGGPSGFLTPDGESEFDVDDDGLGAELSLDEVKMDWPSDATDQVQSIDEVSIESAEMEFDPPPESLSALSPSGKSEMQGDVVVEGGADKSDSVAQDIAGAVDQVEGPPESEDVAEVESILTEIADEQPASGQHSALDPASVEEDSAKPEDFPLSAEEEQILEGVVENVDEVFEQYDPVDEANTKLDLAKAYIDMGDSEGARGALEEVLHQGDEDQRRAAESLLKQIA